MWCFVHPIDRLDSIYSGFGMSMMLITSIKHASPCNPLSTTSCGGSTRKLYKEVLHVQGPNNLRVFWRQSM